MLSHLQWIDQQQQRMADLLQVWACVNTGSYNVEGLAAFARMLQPALGELGGTMREIPLPAQTVITDAGQAESRQLGVALTARSPMRPGPRVLLGIHYDTVFGPEHAFQSVTQVDGRMLRGPGVCDAKGGLIVLLFALLALERSPYAAHLNWEVLLNPDEELGSPGSGTLFAEAAGRNDVGLLFEPALPDGALVSGRKGSGNFTLVVHGRAAHSGRDSAQGRNAIHALSRLVARLADLPIEIPGTTVNTGFIRGGGPVNIVPDLVLCRINIRVDTAAQQQDVERRLRELVAAVPEGISVDLHGGFHCPPKPLTDAVAQILGHLHDCAAQLNLPLDWRATGGVCDGNRLAAAGLPTVDSLGVHGGNMHTDQEFVVRESLAERAKLVALFLMRLAAGDIAIQRGAMALHTEVIRG